VEFTIAHYIELLITGNQGGRDQENIRPEYDGFADVVVKQ